MGSLFYCHELLELCIIAGGPQNQFYLKILYLLEASNDILSYGIEASGLLSKYLPIMELVFTRCCTRNWATKILLRAIFKMFTRVAGSPPLPYPVTASSFVTSRRWGSGSNSQPLALDRQRMYCNKMIKRVVFCIEWRSITWISNRNSSSTVDKPSKENLTNNVPGWSRAGIVVWCS